MALVYITNHNFHLFDNTLKNIIMVISLHGPIISVQDVFF